MAALGNDVSFHGTLPHIFIVIIVIVVAFFVLKSLIKFALIIGAVGLVIYLLWTMGLLERVFGMALPAAVSLGSI